MATLWSRSGTVERHADDIRAGGAKAYFYLGGTNTPMTVFTDAGLGAAHPFPVVADANGRWPDVFVPYINAYDLRTTSAEDIQLTFTLSIPNPDPVNVSVTVPSAITTGMITFEMTALPKDGYVRLNGLSISKGGGGGSERNNDDTINLFQYIWNNMPDSIAPVSGGRGSSAIADFNFPKAITLPDMQGAVGIGLGDMGNPAGIFGGVTFQKGDANTPGSVIGTNSTYGFTTTSSSSGEGDLGSVANNIPRSVLGTWFIKL
jgi:hypothetical protein